jgi:hypothetical protein
MDAIVETCLNCGTPLKEPRRLKSFCDYSCRGQHAVNNLAVVLTRGCLQGLKKPQENQGVAYP